MMGVVKLPTCRMYWQPATRVYLITDNMNVNCFAEILQVMVMHFNGNSQIPTDNYNSSYKIEHLIDTLNNTFRSIVHTEAYLAVDEQIAFFKGMSNLRTYLPKKSKKWGYKLWALAGISGYVYRFELDGGEDCSGPPPGVTPSPRCRESDFVVMRMSHELPPDRHFLFFDNHFSSPKILNQFKVCGLLLP